MTCRMLYVLIGISVVVASAPSQAQEKPAGDSAKSAAARKADVRAILEAGQAGALPAGVVVRISANLTRLESETRRHGAGVEKTFKERWEIASDRVDQIVEERGENGGEFVLRHAESIPFDSRGICRELLAGGILTLGQAEKGERQNFIDTDYDIGHRTIEIVVDGKSVLFVGESCVTAGYAERDARAFASLYESVARKARDAFEAKHARGGQTK